MATQPRRTTTPKEEQDTPSFAPILDRRPSEIERPKALPQGSYIFVTRGVPTFDKARTGTDTVEFTCVPQGPVVNEDGEPEDVDMEALDAALTRKTGEKMDITAKSMRLTFYITEDAGYRLSDFLGHLGFDVEDENEDGPSTRQMIMESQNRQFGGYITHKASPDGSTTYANITRTFGLE